MTNPTNPVLPVQGWYADPAQPGRERYWDGTRWTQIVRFPSVAAPPASAPAAARKSRDPAQDLPLAGWWRRFGSGVIDSVVAWVVAIGLLALVGGDFLQRFWSQYMDYYVQSEQAMWPNSTGTLPLPSAALQQSVTSLTLIVGAVTAAYCITFLGTWGATPGQRLCGIKVIKAPLPAGLIPANATPEFTPEKPGWMRAVSKGLCWALFSSSGGLFMLVQVVNVLLPLFHRRKQSLTDLLASTLMVRSHAGDPRGEQP